ncbi:YoaK family protein [Sphingomonas turrisvirgatae]|uniref:DUF1275 domain-containing protein n=1 Tax=Sphingomonas turrisvirgatae TaxID=1888892 RepID=A0A1E3LT94_9SPHN|nr:DUF1275 family protein [Sphingomonas turrisvirgatae]ODP36040.1 hypothetical protein BFL28_08120 [Sphingomonas turrisvirgatae]
MIRLDRKRQTVAILLAALAGYVDAVAFLASGSYFVSFMSGNSTRLGVTLAAGQSVALVVTLVAAFVTGVAGATLLGRRRRGRRQRIILLVAALLAAAAASAGFAPIPASLALTAAAMGAENAIFADDGDALGLTYMTGALVKIGQRIADALNGGPPLAWLPFAMLWSGLIAGGIVGALGHASSGLNALWPAAIFALVLMPFVGEATHPSPPHQPGL